MTKEQFTEKLRDLVGDAITSDDMSHEELMGVVSFQIFTLYLARATANAEQAAKEKADEQT